MRSQTLFTVLGLAMILMVGAERAGVAQPVPIASPARIAVLGGLPPFTDSGDADTIKGMLEKQSYR